MDTLTFGGSILYRHLTFSEAKKAPIMEANLERALEGLEMNMSTVGVFFFLCSTRKFLSFSWLPTWVHHNDRTSERTNETLTAPPLLPL